MPAVLHLNLHREFFAQIAAGTRRTEYRSRTPDWRRRLEGRHYDVILFRNGYATQAPETLVEFFGPRGYGKSSHGKYAIRLGRILKIKRWPGCFVHRQTDSARQFLSAGRKNGMLSK